MSLDYLISVLLILKIKYKLGFYFASFHRSFLGHQNMDEFPSYVLRDPNHGGQTSRAKSC